LTFFIDFRAELTNMASRFVKAKLRGAVFLNVIDLFPDTDILRDFPFVRKTLFNGTCVESPRTFSA
jgi:hypothetical protein